MKKLNHKKLALGEATGHHHSATAATAVLYGDEDSPVMLSAPKGTEVVHQEHGPITVPAGDYDIVRVQEYDHAAEEARQVAD